jgi:DNA-binding MarR family transcriptional regulator
MCELKMKSRLWLLLVSIISLLIFFGLIIYGLTSAPHGDGAEDRGHPVIPTYIISIAGIILIVALIPLFYYFIYNGLEKNYEKNMEILSKTINENKNTNVKQSDNTDFTKVFLKFLSYNEKKVINKLIEQKGPVLQSEISRLESMGKVKTHRAIKDLEKKGIIVVEKYGNTNRIILSEDLGNILLK